MSTDDRFDAHAIGLESPADRHAEITPSDDDPVIPRPRALWVNVGGTLVLEDGDGTALSYNVEAGQIIPFRAVKVKETGTSATVYRWD
jgi:hypothetical protein